MGKQQGAPAAPPKPVITYSRTITLTAESGVRVNLAYLRELVRQAEQRGYDGSAYVSIHASVLYREISIGDDK